jgi:arsenate reductase-like glutaredoxin family protein
VPKPTTKSSSKALPTAEGAQPPPLRDYVDWQYERERCKTCAAARACLCDLRVVVDAWVLADRKRFDAAATLKMLGRMKTLIAVRGKKFVTFDLKKDRPSDKVLLAWVLGPTKNLRAPAIRVGKTLVVGFHPAAYKQALGRNES